MQMQCEDLDDDIVFKIVDIGDERCPTDALWLGRTDGT
jgi:hypothetical protein